MRWQWRKVFIYFKFENLMVSPSFYEIKEPDIEALWTGCESPWVNEKSWNIRRSLTETPSLISLYKHVAFSCQSILACEKIRQDDWVQVLKRWSSFLRKLNIHSLTLEGATGLKDKALCKMLPRPSRNNAEFIRPQRDAGTGGSLSNCSCGVGEVYLWLLSIFTYCSN